MNDCAASDAGASRGKRKMLSAHLNIMGRNTVRTKSSLGTVSVNEDDINSDHINEGIKNNTTNHSNRQEVEASVAHFLSQQA